MRLHLDKLQLFLKKQFIFLLLFLFLGYPKRVVSQCVSPPPTILTAPTGDITQPPFPDPVWNGGNCGDFFWTIQAPGPCDTITVTMDSYSLVQGLDRVEVCDFILIKTNFLGIIFQIVNFFIFFYEMFVQGVGWDIIRP